MDLAEEEIDKDGHEPQEGVIFPVAHGVELGGGLWRGCTLGRHRQTGAWGRGRGRGRGFVGRHVCSCRLMGHSGDGGAVVRAIGRDTRGGGATPGGQEQDFCFVVLWGADPVWQWTDGSRCRGRRWMGCCRGLPAGNVNEWHDTSSEIWLFLSTRFDGHLPVARSRIRAGGGRRREVKDGARRREGNNMCEQHKVELEIKRARSLRYVIMHYKTHVYNKSEGPPS